MSVWTMAIVAANSAVTAPMIATASRAYERDVVDGVHAADEVDARGDHGRRVDEGADRGRALHGVGQPGVQRDLGRLGDRADEQQERGQLERPESASVRRRTTAVGAHPCTDLEDAGERQRVVTARTGRRRRGSCRRRRSRSSRTPCARPARPSAAGTRSRSGSTSSGRPAPSR